MKKMLAIVLTLALLVTLAAPVFAADVEPAATADDPCSYCGGLAQDVSTYYTDTVGVPSCDSYVGMHTHTQYWKNYIVQCMTCGKLTYYPDVLRYTTCPY